MGAQRGVEGNRIAVHDGTVEPGENSRAEPAVVGVAIFTADQPIYRSVFEMAGVAPIPTFPVGPTMLLCEGFTINVIGELVPGLVGCPRHGGRLLANFGIGRCNRNDRGS